MRELLEQFFRHYLRERNLEDTLALLTDQVISLGTGEQEVARNKEELRALMECEFKEMPQPLDYELFNYTENPLGEYGWSIFTNVLAKIDSEGVTMEMLTENGIRAAEREHSFEHGLPDYLQHDLDAYKEGLKNKSSILDCLWGELYGSINMAEISEGAITPEHADYLRQKYLWKGAGV